jgi:tRNA(Arg) A34 adenosine deaminase TadA
LGGFGEHCIFYVELRSMNLLSAEIANLNLEAFMEEALLEAELAGGAGELPIGAVIVIDNQIISRGRARHNEYRNQIRHAELNAILAAGEPLWMDYQQAILFTTVEPCPLCLGAAVMADIPHIIFALPDSQMQSSHIVETNAYVRRHIKSYHGGVLEERSIKIFNKYDPKGLEYIQRGKK